MTSIVASQPTVSTFAAGRAFLAGTGLVCALALAGWAAAVASGASAPTGASSSSADQAALPHIRVTADARAAEIVAVAAPTVAPAAVPVTELEFEPELITAQRPGAPRPR